MITKIRSPESTDENAAVKIDVAKKFILIWVKSSNSSIYCYSEFSKTFSSSTWAGSAGIWKNNL